MAITLREHSTGEADEEELHRQDTWLNQFTYAIQYRGFTETVCQKRIILQCRLTWDHKLLRHSVALHVVNLNGFRQTASELLWGDSLSPILGHTSTFSPIGYVLPEYHFLCIRHPELCH